MLGFVSGFIRTVKQGFRGFLIRIVEADEIGTLEMFQGGMWSGGQHSLKNQERFDSQVNFELEFRFPPTVL